MTLWRRLSIVLVMAFASLGPVDDAQAGLAGAVQPGDSRQWARAPSAPAGLERPAANGVVGGACDEAALHNALAGGGTVTFSCGGPKTITVATAQTITTATTILGGDVITLTGAGANRLFIVNLSASLSLKHIALTHGRVNGGSGGSIFSLGGLYLDHARIQDSQGHSTDHGGAIATFGPLHITDSTFASNQAGYGGAIYADNFYNTARVVITNTTFSSNHAITNTGFTSGQGGAILLGPGAHLTDISGALFGNTAQSGGALYLMAGSVVTLSTDTSLLFTGNSALWDGGAIYSNHGRLLVVGAEFSGNTTPQDEAALGYGGAIYSSGLLYLFSSYLAHNEGRFGGALCACGDTPTSNAVINSTTFFQNTSGSYGGGLYSNTSVTVTIYSSSFNGNTAGDFGGGLARTNSILTVWDSSFTYNTAHVAGGGLFLSTAPISEHTLGGYVDMRDVTISGNTATGGAPGGGVYNNGLAQLYSLTIKDNSTGVHTETGAETRLRSTVLQNTGANCPGIDPTDDVFNYATDLSCGFSFSTQGLGLNPQLGPLMADGLLRPFFHLPAAASPLVNHGPASPSLCKSADQRGLVRTDRCDIGAVEFRGLLPRLWVPLVVR